MLPFPGRRTYISHFSNFQRQILLYIFTSPIVETEAEEELDTIEDESEIILDRVEEEMLAAYSDASDDENIFHVRDLSTKNKMQKTQEYDFATNVDQEAWKLELERVLPQLKVTIRNDNRDWRGRLDQMKNYQQSIESSMNSVKNQMEKLHKEISLSLEKVQSRERYLNKELEHILNEYRVLQDQLFKVKDTYKSISGGVADRNRQLSILTDRLETVKQQMEERGSSMTDGSKKSVIVSFVPDKKLFYSSISEYKKGHRKNQNGNIGNGC